MKHTNIKYTVGKEVWVRPMDSGLLKGVVVGFELVEPYDPIVKVELRNGGTLDNAFSLDRISPRECDIKSLLLEYIKDMKQLPQVQFSTKEQIEILRMAANKLGLYDAADYLKR